MAKTYRYKVLGGAYVDINGALHSLGEEFDSADPKLREKFPNKFQLVRESAPPPPKLPERKGAKGKPASTPVDKPVSGPAGKLVDVTKDHPKAIEYGLRVLRDNKAGYWLVDGDDDDAINDAPLAEGDVDSAIERYLD